MIMLKFLWVMMIFYGVHGYAQNLSWNNVIAEDNFSLFSRTRFEMVDKGDAETTRRSKTSSRFDLGYTLPLAKGLKLFVEGQAVVVWQEDLEHLNQLITAPVVADPEFLDWNQYYADIQTDLGLHFRLGRQAINLGNQRFIGRVNFRQNDQTFFAGQASFKREGLWSLSYIYIHEAYRVLDEDAKWDVPSHLVHFEVSPEDFMSASAYMYDINVNSEDRDYLTFGGHVKFSVGKKSQKLNLFFECAYQDAQTGTEEYDTVYWHGYAEVKWKEHLLCGGWEHLGGDGSNSFQTPLATLHKFNGWADIFLTTPANGLEDYYVKYSFMLAPSTQVKSQTKATVIHHWYRGDIDANYGREWNFGLQQKFNKNRADVDFSVQYAWYTAEDSPYVDENRLWASMSISI